MPGDRAYGWNILRRYQQLADKSAEIGSVTAQAATISKTVFQLTAQSPLRSPIPIMALELTSVVDTGRPRFAAAVTNAAVVRFALNPS